jgi:tetratricopeptide (TPR) repeat protein
MAMNRKERRAAAKQIRGKVGATGISAKVEQAIALAQAGTFDQAEALLEAALRANPEDAEAKHQLGMVQVRTGRTQAGLKLMREAVEVRPGESLYWNNLAAAYLSVEMSEQAAEAARKATELSPGYGMAWQNLAFALRDLKQHAAAIDAFEAGIKVDELSVESLASWADSLGNEKRLVEAEVQARRALERAPKDPAILSLLGWVLVEQNKDVEARDAFKQSLDLKPDQLLAALNYGLLLLKINETETALRWLRRATSIDPRSVVAWRVLAEQLFKSGLKDEALPTAERAARLAPEDTVIADILRKLKGGSAPEVGPNEIVIEYGDEGGAKAKTSASEGVFDLSQLHIIK